jgi:hypothetical protein
LVKNTPQFIGSLGGITQSVTESALNRLVDRILTNLEEFDQHSIMSNSDREHTFLKEIRLGMIENEVFQFVRKATTVPDPANFYHTFV